MGNEDQTMQPAQLSTGATASDSASTAIPRVSQDVHGDSAGDKRKRPARDDSRAAHKGRGGRGKMSAKKSRRNEAGRSRDDTSAAWGRDRIEEARRRKQEREDYKPPIYGTEFSKEEIAAEDRKPKRKVAVMIGYAGTGYYGMQLSHDLKTIEGDLFRAFVQAGAVSKANADDPKKIGFARCARTDKGVHAAGNVISLKLIVEDDDILEKINEKLVPQIRVWGIERTLNSFNAYTHVDSRVYEYLIPTHCFLPPHPKSYLGRKLSEHAKEMGDFEAWEERQNDVASFWAEAEEKYVKPALQEIDPELREPAWDGVFEAEEPIRDDQEGGEVGATSLEETRDSEESAEKADTGKLGAESVPLSKKGTPLKGPKVFTKMEEAQRKLKAALMEAKRDWRINPSRMAKVKSAFSKFEGVRNFHNYTIRMKPKDQASKRVIKSFVVNETPILINGTEWLSLKVHGQSFMMHQIRKMVGMATLVVRCGTHEARLQDSMGFDRISIPRAPGLGLLLERPIFDNYNKRLTTEQGGVARNEVGFESYQEEIDAFKQKEIYDRIYREEANGNVFHQLFWAVDSFKRSQFLYLTSKGLAAVEKGAKGNEKDDKVEQPFLEESSDEDDVKNEGN